MDAVNENRSLFFLIDDDPHSARFFMNKLNQQIENGATDVHCVWLKSADEGLDTLNLLRSEKAHRLPKLVIVDLKSSSHANEDFVSVIAPITREIGVPVVVMLGRLEEEASISLIDAGAERVFERRANRDEFIGEIGKIIDFSVYDKLNQRIEA